MEGRERGEEKRGTIEPTVASGEVAAGSTPRAPCRTHRRTPEQGYGGDQRWKDTWGGVTRVERRRGRARTKGGALSPASEGKRGRAEGVQRKKKGKRDQGPICKI
jgi:hypothetical protein